MRYRTLSPSGDYVFGAGPSEFLVNTPETVAQAVSTRMRLFTNEWFLDTEEGLPLSTKILGAGTQSQYDQAIQERILGTQGVISITEYASLLDQNRNLTVSALIETLYGPTTIQQVL